jgi:predicted secreted protein
MKKIILALSLMTGSYASAMTQYNFHNLGFSPSGYTFAFAESAEQDGSGYPVANVFIVNVEKNMLVSAERAMITAEDGSVPADALKLAVAKSKVKLDKLAIKPGKNLGQDITLNKQSDNRASFSVGNDNYELNLSERDANNATVGSGCFTEYDQSKLITLTLSQLENGQEKTITLQEDKYQPKSRFCSSNYSIEKAIRLGKSLVVVLSYNTPGFEGPDTNYLVVTGKLP